MQLQRQVFVRNFYSKVLFALCFVAGLVAVFLSSFALKLKLNAPGTEVQEQYASITAVVNSILANMTSITSSTQDIEGEIEGVLGGARVSFPDLATNSVIATEASNIAGDFDQLTLQTEACCPPPPVFCQAQCTSGVCPVKTKPAAPYTKNIVLYNGIYPITNPLVGTCFSIYSLGTSCSIGVEAGIRYCFKQLDTQCAYPTIPAAFAKNAKFVPGTPSFSVIGSVNN